MTTGITTKIGNKKLFRNNALDIMRVSFNSELKDIKDEDLVKLTQQDMDAYRDCCKWECKCGHEMAYKHSLFLTGEKYIHEIKCNELFEESGCKEGMFLVHPTGKEFNSSNFDELYARYQDRIIAEASKASFNEDAYDMYAALSGFFPKIVAKFAREKSFSNKSDSWFSSYFWISVKNKSTDIKKARFYIKRSPTVICEICNKTVGGINVKHLMSAGHEIIRDKFYEKLGSEILEDKHFSMSESKECERKKLKKMAVSLGKKNFKKMNPEVKNRLINNEFVGIYLELFPESTINNFVLSTNELVCCNSDNEVEYGDMVSESRRVGYAKSNDLELKDMTRDLVSRIIAPNIFKFKRLFRDGVVYDDKIRIINEIIFTKSSYNNIGNKDLDDDYKGLVKPGLSAAIFDFISKSCVVEEICVK